MAQAEVLHLILVQESPLVPILIQTNFKIMNYFTFSDFVVNNSGHVVRERPKTACIESSLKVIQNNSVARPFSAGVTEAGQRKGCKMVRFDDGCKSVHSKGGESLNPSLYCETLPDEIEKVCICSLEEDAEHQKGRKEEQSSDLDAKKSKPSRNSCRSFNFFISGDSCDEDSDEDDTFDTKVGQFSGSKNSDGRGTSNNLSVAASFTDFEPAASGGQDTNQNCCDCAEDVLCSCEDLSGDSRDRKPCTRKDSCDKQTAYYTVADGSEKQNESHKENFVLEKTHVFNFVAKSKSKSLNGHNIYASHTSAEYNMSPRGRVSSPLSSKSGSVPPLTFESLEAEISSVQNDIRHFLENKAEMDELETHRDHNLDDLVVNQKPCQVLTLYEHSKEITDDTVDTSDSEDEQVAVIAVDSEDDQVAESLFTRGHYSDMLLSGELIQKQLDAESRQTKKLLKHSSETKHLAKSTGSVGRPDRDKGNSECFTLTSVAFETDSGCGSEVTSVSHGDLSVLEDVDEEEDKVTGKKQTVSFVVSQHLL